ncbi:MAG: hypothetical protein P4L53_20425 [Candidatus Obscuribacterales bacterium]|nr:hypothetical protein [Candidatus Obscuribacterales bacterium]
MPPWVSKLLVAITCAVVLTPPAVASDLWMSLGPNIRHQAPRWQGIRSDTGALWNTDAPWKTVAANTRVVLFSGGQIDWADDADLASAFADMQRRHIAFGLEDSVLVQSERCKCQCEAYGKAGALESTLAKIQRNGGKLQYLRMDEPFFFGHVFSDPTACHEPIQQLAVEVAESIKLIRKYFPDVQVGDVEPIDNCQIQTKELTQWFDAFETATGTGLAFFHTDLVWSDIAMQRLGPLSRQLAQRRIPMGIIYNADDTGTSDQSWEQSAVSHFTKIESLLNIHPDQAIIHSWVDYPGQVLPEGQPGTLTHVAFRYLRPLPQVKASRESNIISGQLTTPQGQPMPNCRIRIDAVDSAGVMRPVWRNITGTVPAQATTAVMGIRINIEGAKSCAGKGRATIGVLQYKEPETGKQFSVPPLQDAKPQSDRSLWPWPGIGTTFTIDSEKTTVANLKTIAVTPGAKFVLASPMAASANAEKSGYATVIFMDAKQKGLLRRMLWFEPSIDTLGTTTTDANGKFQFAIPDAVARSQFEIRVCYPGSQAMRPAETGIKKL